MLSFYVPEAKTEKTQYYKGVLWSGRLKIRPYSIEFLRIQERAVILGKRPRVKPFGLVFGQKIAEF